MILSGWWNWILGCHSWGLAWNLEDMSGGASSDSPLRQPTSSPSKNYIVERAAGIQRSFAITG